MLETRLNGYFPPDYPVRERINLSRLWASGTAPPPRALPPTRIADARPLQSEAKSEAAFFDEHGFVLLDAPTAMGDWDDAGQIEQVYLPEIERLIRTRLYPGRSIEVRQFPQVVRRGAGTDNPFYGNGVHQDYGTLPEDYQHSVEAFAGREMGERWRANFGREAVRGFAMLDFWRTTNMPDPLEHMPLALCDPGSVDSRDIVPTELEGIAPGGAATRHVGLRYNPDQRWFYYPGMTSSETLVFKLFEVIRGVDAQPYRACFHSAVEDPSASPGAQPRQSCEHRVAVMLLD